MPNVSIILLYIRNESSRGIIMRNTVDQSDLGIRSRYDYVMHGRVSRAMRMRNIISVLGPQGSLTLRFFIIGSLGGGLVLF